MILNKDIIKELAQTAVDAALKAGAFIESNLSKEVKVENKQGGDSLASQVVTEVDLKSQEIILGMLNPTFSAYDIALLTEEFEDDGSRLEKDYFWCIDPIDGTLPFIDRTSGFAVSIALVDKHGTPHIGVVYDPYDKNLYHAIKGEGAFSNNNEWEQTVKSNSDCFTWVMDRSFVNYFRYEELLADIKEMTSRLGYKELKLIQHGGAVMNAMWTLKSIDGCYFKFPKPKKGGGCLWDYSATTCIYNELKAHVSDFDNKPLELNRTESYFMNHKGVMFTTSNTVAEELQKIHLKYKNV